MVGQLAGVLKEEAALKNAYSGFFPKKLVNVACGLGVVVPGTGMPSGRDIVPALVSSLGSGERHIQPRSAVQIVDGSDLGTGRHLPLKKELAGPQWMRQVFLITGLPTRNRPAPVGHLAWRTGYKNKDILQTRHV